MKGETHVGAWSPIWTVFTHRICMLYLIVSVIILLPITFYYLVGCTGLSSFTSLCTGLRLFVGIITLTI